MRHRRFALLAALVAALTAPALAQEATPAASAAPAAPAAPTPGPTPNAGEAKFVAQVRADLAKRYATVAAAERAGYLRFGNEDKTGSISYALRQWTSVDAAHPTQLWYDAKGRLLGADYSVLQADSPQQPTLWGVQPARWDKFGMHIHYGLAGANGAVTYGAMRAAKYTDAGGDAQHPTPDGLVKAGIAKSADQVKFVFLFPAIWDLQVWVLPNPSGAFAEYNPSVKPSANAGGMPM